MGGNSAETLFPVTYAPMRGVRRAKVGRPNCTKLQYFIFTSNSLSTVLESLWGEVAFGRRKKHDVLFIFPVLMKTDIFHCKRFRNGPIKGELDPNFSLLVITRIGGRFKLKKF